MDYTLALVLMVLFVALILVGVHVAFALMIAGIMGIFFAFHGNLYALQVIIWDNTSGYTLTVLVYFILLGEIMLAGNISSRLYNGALTWLNRIPGSIMHVNIMGSMIFAAVTGLSVATVATLGRIAYIEGDKRRIPVSDNLGSLAAGATLGILIPPSVPLILYGLMAEQSIGRLFIAGALPGLMLSAMFMVFVAVRALLRRRSETVDATRYTWKQRFSGLMGMLPVCALIFVVLGTIYFGWGTPNEAGGVGCLFGFILVMAYREFKWKDIWVAFERTGRVTAMIMFLIIGAKTLTYYVANIGIPYALSEWVTGQGFSPWAVMVLICLVYVILGMFIDSFSIIILTIPIIYPIILQLGFDPILFGIIVVILIEIGLITPPYGINLYVLDGITGGGNLGSIIRGILPYFFIMLLAVVIIFAFPQIALWLPSRMM